MNFKLLDCTIRDGGYYTQWDFDKGLIANYFRSFERLPVDYLELGYRSMPMENYLGEYFYCPVSVLEMARSHSSKKLVIILNEKDVRPDHLPALLDPCRGIIDLVRLAVNPANFSRALVLAEGIRKMGFDVSFNMMYMSDWPEMKDFLNTIGEVTGLAEYFYMVDSFGGVYPEDVRRTYELVRNATDVKIGFHGHNNLELAFINTITAIDCGADIVDATITGMGRGAGNLKTELLLTALNASHELEVDFNALSGVVDDFTILQKKYEWGTNLPYMVSGANSLPQKEVMEWVTKRWYSVNSIIRALNNKKKGIEDNQRLPVFQPDRSYAEVLIIGGGPSAVEKAGVVKEFIQKKGSLALIHASSKNAAAYQDQHHVQQYFCLVGNEGHRMESVFENLQGFEGLCVLPPYPREMGTYIPTQVESRTHELSSIDFVNTLQDSHTALALQTAISLGARTIYLVGYDGYNTGDVSQKERELFAENEYLFAHVPDGISLISLVPTAYTLPIESVFSQLI